MKIHYTGRPCVHRFGEPSFRTDLTINNPTPLPVLVRIGRGYAGHSSVTYVLEPWSREVITNREFVAGVHEVELRPLALESASRHK